MSELKHVKLVREERRRLGGTHHGGVHVKVTKRAHMGEHGGHDSQEVLDFSVGRGAHPPLHKDGVRWPHAEPAIGIMMGKLRIRPLSAAAAATAAVI